ncbi:DUF6472 family protein [Ruminococcus sp.]|uniref:DUF6472 family protein n=1 Tax=Ruminococcus sp. TaxID=41978 RepID=UPI0025D04FB9|nr:DUF6472 family protein [Ruminococcus sp.]MBQ8967974.1 hypothetical protein [Ruminococcus sp.]
MNKGKKKTYSSCESCNNYAYDEEYECYTCEVNLDEDEMYRLYNEPHYACPYYRSDDDYAIVRKQN